MTQKIDASAQAAKFPHTEIVTVTPRVGPESIEGFYDEYLAIPGVLEQILLDTDSDAFILACWGDPGIESAREITGKTCGGHRRSQPLHGQYAGSQVERRHHPLHRARDMVEKTVHKAGMTGRCASVRTTSLSVLEHRT